MTAPLVLDIETVPLLSSLNAVYPEAERNPPANYKSEEAITKWRASDRERWTEGLANECSLNPRLGRVLCVGMELDGGGSVAYANAEYDEARILTEFWEMAARANGQVVTWNGSWDLRFLIIRSLAHGLTPSGPVRDWFRKYTTRPHFDCKAVLLNWDVKVSGEGLDEWATFLGLGGKTDGMSGADVWPLFQKGEHGRIADYCRQDVAATAAIYERIAPMFA